MLLILLTAAPAFAGETGSAVGYPDQFVAMMKKFGAEVLSFIVGVVILVWLAKTPLGFLGFGAVFVFNTHEALGFGWSVAAYFLTYGLVFGLGGAILPSVFGGSKPPETKTSGPIGGSHAAEAMILDKHYEDPLARHGARYIRDKLLG
jgi:hypothetical protein